jgi:hypothetical protein
VAESMVAANTWFSLQLLPCCSTKGSGNPSRYKNVSNN